MYVASLSPFQIRQLNDDINALIKEKGRWEFRVKSLGGKIHMVSESAHTKNLFHFEF
jgi:Isy1-like splicing family